MNNDIYAEWLVKRKKPAYAPLVYAGVVLLVLIGLIASLLNPFGFLFLLLAVGAGYFAGMKMNVEYEYVFVTNELSIDRISGQKSRKRIENLEMQKVDKVISTRSHEFDYVKTNPKAKVIDYSSRTANADTYAIFYSGQFGQEIYLFEPNDKLLKCMKNSAPRKVTIEQSITAKN